MNARPPIPEPLRPALDRLAAAGATGALRASGSPRGTIWLVDGEIGYADTPVMPGVGERLTASGRLTHRAWHVAQQSATVDGRDATRALVDEGHLAYGELASQVRATVYDAAYLVLADGDASARFHAGLRHWLGDITTPRLADPDAEMTRRRRPARSARPHRRQPRPGDRQPPPAAHGPGRRGAPRQRRPEHRPGLRDAARDPDGPHVDVTALTCALPAGSHPLA